MVWSFSWTFWRLDMHSLALKDPVWCLTTLGKAKAKFDWAKCKSRRLLSGSNPVYTEHHREWHELECCVAQRDPAGRIEGLQEGELWTAAVTGLSGGLARRLQSERLSKRPLASPPEGRCMLKHVCGSENKQARTFLFWVLSPHTLWL